MREIKFRGLNRKEGNEYFVYGMPKEDLPGSTAYYNTHSMRICWNEEDGTSCNAPIRNGTLGQYTGLKDKNGKEIYEGDIIKEDYEFSDDRKFTCVWNDNHSCFSFKNEDGYIVSNFNIEGTKYFSIVGNIYENTELLK